MALLLAAGINGGARYEFYAFVFQQVASQCLSRIIRKSSIVKCYYFLSLFFIHFLLLYSIRTVLF